MEIKVENQIEADILNNIQGFKDFSFYHTYNWLEFLSKTFNWKIKAIVVYKSGEPVFFLPYINKMKPSLKSCNVSLPLSHKFGPAHKEGIANNFVEIYKEISEIGCFEIHNKVESPNFVEETTHTFSTLDLTKFKDVDEIFSNLNKDSIQRKITKSKKEGVTVKEVNSEEGFKIYSKMQSKTRKKQGSPGFPKNYFDNLYEIFMNTDFIKLYLAYCNEKPVSGVIFSFFKDTATYLYGASESDRDLYKIGVNQVVMWEAIKRAYDSGYKIIDFGKTPNYLKSLQEYKLKWGAKATPLYYSYTNEKNIGDINREGLFAKGISEGLKMMPLSVFDVVSPYLFKLVI